MLISMLKYIKILKSTPTCFDLNRSSSGSRSVPRWSYWIIYNLKSTEFKILIINPGVVAAIHVAGYVVTLVVQCVGLIYCWMWGACVGDYQLL